MLPIFSETHPAPWAELALAPQKGERIVQGMRIRENPSIYFSIHAEVFQPLWQTGLQDLTGKGEPQVALAGIFYNLLTEKKYNKKCDFLASVQPE